MARRFKLNLALLTRLIGMSVITVFAILVMIAVNLKGRKIEQSGASDDEETKAALVSVVDLDLSPVEITKKYSGTIRPFERYMLSFKTAGRVMELGLNKDGKELDEGDEIKAGMILAKMDIRLLKAQKAELIVAQEFAESEFERANKLWQENSISETEFSRYENEKKIAKLRLETLETQIEDGILRSKVDGVISKRLIKAGESVNLGQTVFELIQVDKVKLVVGVPESRVRRIIGRKNGVADPKAYVEMIGRDNANSSLELTGTVRRVGQASDDKSGLFEVEILLDNSAGLLRPGMIGIARIIVDRFEGFRVPVDAAFFREKEVFVFAVDTYESVAKQNDAQQPESKKQKTKKTSRSPDEIVARKHVFSEEDYEIQDNDLVIRKMEPAATKVIIGGHRRLVNGRKIEVVAAD